MTAVERQTNRLDEDRIVEIGKKEIRHVVRVNPVIEKTADAAKTVAIVVSVFDGSVPVGSAYQAFVDIDARYVVAVSVLPPKSRYQK